MQAPQLSEDELNSIYNWVDEIPLSKPKKNIARDFADGVLAAEIVYHFLPKLIEIHNYSSAHSTSAKLYNWNTLNQKVFKKMGFQITKSDIEAVINCVPEAIERVLQVIKLKLEKYLDRQSESNDNMQPQSNPYYNQKPINQNQGYSPNLINQQQQQHQDYQMSGDMLAKDQTIQELKETVEILELKIKKLEQLVKLKDSKIQTLQNKLAQAGLA